MSAVHVEAFDKVFQLASVVGDQMNAALAQVGLNPARAEVLLVLHHRESPMRQRELSQALRCTPRHVTTLVDVLEQDGLVNRKAHPTDRRATLVTLSDRGARVVADLNNQRQEAAAAVLGNLPARDLAGFLAVADRVLAHLSPGGDTAGEQSEVQRGSTAT